MEILFFGSLVVSALVVIAAFFIVARARHPAQYLLLTFGAVAVAWAADVALVAPTDRFSQMICVAVVPSATAGFCCAWAWLERQAATPLAVVARRNIRHPWQFSLREMFLAVLAASLVIALIIYSRPLSTSDFFKSLTVRDPFASMWKRNGIQAWESSRSESVDSTRATLQFVVETDTSTDTSAQQLVADLKIEIDSLLKQSGGRIGELPSKRDFCISYESGGNYGDLWEYPVQASDHHWTILLLATESKK